MKLTNGEIYNAKEPLQQLVSTKLPIRISHALAQLASMLDGQLLVIESEREKLIKHYGEPSETNPNQIEVTPENISAFSVEVGELMQIEVDVAIEPVEIKLDSLPEDFSVEPVLLMALRRFVHVTQIDP